MLSYSLWFSAPGIWMGAGLESHCVGRVYGAGGAVRRTYIYIYIYIYIVISWVVLLWYCTICVGVTLWFGWGSVVSGCRLKHS